MSDCFKGHFIALERENGVPRIRVVPLDGGQPHYVSFPEPVYVAGPAMNAEFDTSVYRFSYESFITPPSVFDYNVTTQQRQLLKQQPVLGGYDPALYSSERVYATAADGARVPVSIVYRKELARDGRRPMLLEGYGSYGYPIDVDFSSQPLSLLDRGIVFAHRAHPRRRRPGQAMARRRQNAGQDEHLHRLHRRRRAPDRQRYTSTSASRSQAERRRAAHGRRHQYAPRSVPAVAVAYVPFVDVMNTMLDASLPLTVGEYEEWGDPNEKAAYDYMLSYSPYDNIEAKSYPVMLVRTSVHDSQVPYWEAAKYVAKLRAMKTDGNLLLFKVKLEPGGHGGASGRYDRLRDLAFDYAFVLAQFGITK